MIEAHRCPKCDLRSSVNDEQSWMKVTQKGICTPDYYDRLEASCPSIRALMYSQLGHPPGDGLCQRDALVSIQDVQKKVVQQIEISRTHSIPCIEQNIYQTC